jgi:hypothetical protein
MKPTKLQQDKLEKMFGCSRFVWNYFLDLKIQDIIYQKN